MVETLCHVQSFHRQIYTVASRLRQRWAFGGHDSAGLCLSFLKTFTSYQRPSCFLLLSAWKHFLCDIFNLSLQPYSGSLGLIASDGTDNSDITGDVAVTRGWFKHKEPHGAENKAGFRTQLALLLVHVSGVSLPPVTLGLKGQGQHVEGAIGWACA